MANILPLKQPLEWGYDVNNKQLLVRLQEAAPDDATDPASWIPHREAIVRIDIANINLTQLADPTA